MSKRQKAIAIAGLLLATSGKDASETLLALYVEAVNEYDASDVQLACAQLLRTEEWITPSKLVQQIEGGDLPTIDDAADAAYGVACESAARVGATYHVHFDDAILQATLLSLYGGWVEFCESEPETKFNKDKAKFVSEYARHARMGVDENGRATRKLAGRATGGTFERAHGAVHFDEPQVISIKVDTPQRLIEQAHEKHARRIATNAQARAAREKQRRVEEATTSGDVARIEFRSSED